VGRFTFIVSIDSFGRTALGERPVINRAPWLPFAILIFCGLLIYTFRLTDNPAGFFIDESSIAYNAFTISQSGRDEFGNYLPLFFRSFGDYKNPVYIYLLAAIFKITGPSILVARLLSACAGVTTATLLGILAMRIATQDSLRSRQVWMTGLIITTSAILTPWLFELSRVSLEVSIYPLTVVLFLLCAHRAATKPTWGWIDAMLLASTLALLTYSYSIGRLLAPLLAVGLTFLATRERWAGLLRTWAIYLLSLLPLFTFQRLYNGALTNRFNLISYIKPGNSLVDNAWQFIKHYLGNLDPRRFVLNGDPNYFQITHLYGKPVLLFVTFVLFILGIVIVIWRRRQNRWWCYMLYAFVVSVIPVSLTVDYFHILRLSGTLILIFVLAVPAVEWLLANESHLKRALITFALVAIVAQGVVFQWQYHASATSPWRRHLFDADYPSKIFEPAIATGATPIYLVDTAAPSYIHAYWYATLKGIPISRFAHLKLEETPPTGSLVIAAEEDCWGQGALARVEPYTLYVAAEPDSGTAPLPDTAFRAELTVPRSYLTVHIGDRIEMNVTIRNKSLVVWPRCERGPTLFQVYLGSHWLDQSGQYWVSEQGRYGLPVDLPPNGEATIKFNIPAPSKTGTYLLELDLFQADVTWFSKKGSQTTKVRVTVN